MDIRDFIREAEGYTVPELELICTTQKDLYTPEEMQIIVEVLACKRKQEKNVRSKAEFGETIFCIISLLIPIIGFIAGILLLAAGPPKWKRTGKRVLLAAFISVLIRVFLNAGGFSV